MKPVVTVVWLALIASLFRIPAWAAGSTQCPIEQLVGRIQRINGDHAAVHLFRHGLEVPLTQNACILYGDRLEAGLAATVLIETAQGSRHVGGDFDPEWQVPEARGAISPSASAFLATLLQGLSNRTPPQGAYIVGRGGKSCPSLNATPQSFGPLDRLRPMDQQIGADLRVIVAAWRPSSPAQDVYARVLRADGTTIVEGHTCLEAHLALPLPPGALHLGDRLSLEVADNRGDALHYNLVVVRPADLPHAPVSLPDSWIAAAWRLAAASPGMRLDSISRIEMAPPDALGAQLILQAVWTDSPF